MKRIQIDLQLNQISKFIQTPSKHSKPTTEVITWSDLQARREKIVLRTTNVLKAQFGLV